MSRAVIIMCLITGAATAWASDPESRWLFEQVPNLQDVIVPYPPEVRFGLPTGKVDVVLATRKANGMLESKIILKGAVLVMIDGKANTATLRLPSKHAARLRQACGEGHVFLVQPDN